MAAEVLSQAGVKVDLYDAMPSVGRKFLMAGKGGMNITHSEPFDKFLSRYGSRQSYIKPMLDRFGPEALRAWVQGLGIATFIGSSGKVFPVDMKAAPLLRAWLHRLRANGVNFYMRHQWLGWDDDGMLRFLTPEGERKSATMPWFWLWAAVAGRDWVLQARGCRCWHGEEFRLSRCSPRIAGLTWFGASFFAVVLPDSL